MPLGAFLRVASSIARRMSTTVLRPTPLEIAAGVVVGEDPGAPRLPEVDPALHPLTALEEAVRPALEKPPCLVAFSGGRDSSLVLAVATQVARKHGLPLPIPSTDRFPDRPGVDEAAWQERVVRFLDLPEWRCASFTDEFDFLGPVAQTVLLAHGLLWPPNSFADLPMLQEADRGTVITGYGGDIVLGDWRWGRAAEVLFGRVRPTRRDVLRVALALAPRFAKRAWGRRHDVPPIPWLRQPARETMETALVDEAVGQPLTWERRVPWVARRRWLAAVCGSADLLAGSTGSRIEHPLLDRKFLATLVSVGGRRGFPTRTSTLRALFPGVLPNEVLSRTTKASFSFVYWGRRSRQFSEEWTGRGIPNDLADESALREAWSADVPDARAAMLLQAAWLASTLNCDFPDVYAHGADGRGGPPAVRSESPQRVS